MPSVHADSAPPNAKNINTHIVNRLHVQLWKLPHWLREVAHVYRYRLPLPLAVFTTLALPFLGGSYSVECM
jgi:hypothetical protein